MYLSKRTLVALLCAVIAIDGHRWYTASLINTNIYAQLNLTPNVIQDGEMRFRPVATVIRETLELPNSIRKKDVTTSFPSSERVLERSIVTTSTSPSIDDLSFNDSAKIRRKDYFNHRIIWRNHTINNTNVLTRLPKKRKIVKRCPALPQRRKKQSSGRKAKFLEVFQVVEFQQVPCTSSSGLEGVCLHEYECTTSGGLPMGDCADGYGTCCVTQFSCGEQSSAQTGWFVNPNFPLPSNDRLACAVTLNKLSKDIQQIRLDFLTFELLQPTSGTCEQDQFVVSGQNVNNIVPILCGINNGQHSTHKNQKFLRLLLTPYWEFTVYIEVSDVAGPFFFTVQTVTADSRLFAIKITQLTSADDLTVPTGCLQYYKEAHGFLESFNYQDTSIIALAKVPSYLNYLNYAMCIERATETCSITYTNTGDMEIVNYDDYRPLIPPGQAGVEIFNCPTDWLLISATRMCGERLNDGSVLQDFSLDAPVTDIAAGPIVVWFRSDGAYVGRGFRLEYQQNSCTNSA